MHAIAAPGGEQIHTFSLGGQSWSIDPELDHADEITARAFGAWNVVDTEIIGGAGGRAHAVGDFFYGDLRRPFTVGGMWGLMRVIDPAAVKPDLKPLG